jgi:ribonuclease E
MSIEVVRKLMLAGNNPQVKRVMVRVHEEVAAYLNNRKRRELTSIEERGGMQIQILGSEHAYPEFLELSCLDARDRPMTLETN